jgi:site-specific DNA recombinase
MKQCFGYMRVSTQKQGEGVSLEAQRAAIEQFASRNEIEIIHWFEEKQTAAKSGRPIFGAMLRQLKRHKAAGIVMHKIDRSARNFADWAKIGDLADAGIDVHFATETLDFRSRGGRLSADIQAVIAADYIRNLRDECLKGMYGRLKQGLYPWGAPLGYRNNGKGKPKTPDPLVAPLIRELFELYATGSHSIRSLRHAMTARGLRGTAGAPLSKHGIEVILANPFYCGIMKVRSTGDIYPGCHEPLIPASLFERVQLIKAGKAGKKVTRHNHLYRGLFHCAFCGYAMIPERQKGRVYYRCHTSSCPTTAVREDQIESAILSQLEKGAFADNQIDEIQEAVSRWPERDHAQEEIKAKELQVAQVAQRLDQLTDALIDRLIDQDTFRAKKERFAIERQRLIEEIVELRESAHDAVHLRRFLERMKSLAQTYVSANPQEKRQIVEMATSNRTVSRKDIALEPQTWLHALHEWGSAPFGEHQRPNSRTDDSATSTKLEALVKASKSPEAAILRRLTEGEDEDDDLPVAA